MNIYISIPISGHEAEARERADIMKATLSRAGHSVVTPFDVYAGKNPSYEDYICYDLRAMLSCEAVFFCKGWEDSLGCNIEHDVITRFNNSGRKNFKIFYETPLKSNQDAPMV